MMRDLTIDAREMAAEGWKPRTIRLVVAWRSLHCIFVITWGGIMRAIGAVLPIARLIRLIKSGG